MNFEYIAIPERKEQIDSLEILFLSISSPIIRKYMIRLSHIIIFTKTKIFIIAENIFDFVKYFDFIRHYS